MQFGTFLDSGSSEGFTESTLRLTQVESVGGILSPQPKRPLKSNAFDPTNQFTSKLYCQERMHIFV